MPDNRHQLRLQQTREAPKPTVLPYARVIPSRRTPNIARWGLVWSIAAWFLPCFCESSASINGGPRVTHSCMSTGVQAFVAAIAITINLRALRRLRQARRQGYLYRGGRVAWTGLALSAVKIVVPLWP